MAAVVIQEAQPLVRTERSAGRGNLCVCVNGCRTNTKGSLSDVHISAIFFSRPTYASPTTSAIMSSACLLYRCMAVSWERSRRGGKGPRNMEASAIRWRFKKLSPEQDHSSSSSAREVGRGHKDSFALKMTTTQFAKRDRPLKGKEFQQAKYGVTARAQKHLLFAARYHGKTG